jgi:hypothetical protein
MPVATNSNNPSPDAAKQQLNQTLISTFEQIFAAALPPQIALAAITSLADVNGDGFADITVVIGLRVPPGKGHPLGIELIQVVFDGTSATGATIGAPTVIGIF